MQINYAKFEEIGVQRRNEQIISEQHVAGGRAAGSSSVHEQTRKFNLYEILRKYKSADEIILSEHVQEYAHFMRIGDRYY